MFVQRWNNTQYESLLMYTKQVCQHSRIRLFFSRKYQTNSHEFYPYTTRMNVIPMSVLLNLLCEWKSPIIYIEPMDFLVRNFWMKYEMNKLKFKQSYHEQRQSNMNHLFGINLNLLIRKKKRSMLIGFEFNTKFYRIYCLRICAN